MDVSDDPTLFADLENPADDALKKAMMMLVGNSPKAKPMRMILKLIFMRSEEIKQKRIETRREYLKLLKRKEKLEKELEKLRRNFLGGL